MDKNIDTARRKPRQLRGTPSNRYSIYFSFGVLGLGILIGTLFHYSAGQKIINEIVKSDRFGMTEEEINRKIEMAPPGLTPSKELKERLEKLKKEKNISI